MRVAPRFAFLTAGLVLVVAPLALAHRERPIASPPRSGQVPDLNRVSSKTVVVCKPSSKPTKAEHDAIHLLLQTATGPALDDAQARETAWHANTKLFKKCRYEHVQEAVNAVGDGTAIKVLPGVYREEPSRAQSTSSSGDLPDGSYSYEYHVAHPNDANLVAILGKKNITLEGTGAHPRDVLLDVGFVKDVGIRCDRCEGFIVRNLWERDANEHGIYVVDSDGYIFDRTVGSYNREYELFSFASDHGLYTDCEAEGGGDSGLYVGGAPKTPGRFSCEIRRCNMHHNALGFSGTQGSYIWMHNNQATDNAIGISFDSENDHPNFPQAGSLIEDNDFHDNNYNIYAADSDVPPGGPAYNFFQYPVGTGMWIVGGEDNTIQNNRVYNNGSFGFILAGNALETPLPAQIHRNSFKNNLMGTDVGNGAGPNGYAFAPGGNYAPGGSDFFWDGSGNDNCWGPNGNVTMDPNPLPGPCPQANTGSVILPVEDKLEGLLSCALSQVPGSDPPVYHTNDTFYPCPFGQTNNAPYLNKDERECGNGAIDVGEDCDPGYNGYPAAVTETCATLGHGPGTLGCTPFCTFDTTGCAAVECQEYGASRARLKDLGSPAGNDDVAVTAADVSGAGRTFDPRTEETSLVVRDDGGAVYSVTIPAGSGDWSATGSRFNYNGSLGGLQHFGIHGNFTKTFRFEADAKDQDLSAAADTQTVSTVLRVGDDCWADTVACTVSSSGELVSCRGRKTP